MADGFLSPEGIFYKRESLYHYDTASLILKESYGKDKNSSDPVELLVNKGFIVFFEGRNMIYGGTPDNFQDTCFVSCIPTDEQADWIQHHLSDISVLQQFKLNEKLRKMNSVPLSDVYSHDVCLECIGYDELYRGINKNKIPDSCMACHRCPFKERC